MKAERSEKKLNIVISLLYFGGLFSVGFYDFFQLPYINANDVMPVVDWMKKAVFYQIFVDRFFMGNSEKDTSYINMAWEDKPTPKSSPPTLT